jgi:hypothetical protein
LREEYRLRIFESTCVVLRKILGSNRGEVTRGRRALRDVELCDLYSSSNIFCVMEARRMKWAGNVTLIRRSINARRLIVGKLKAENYLEDLCVDGRILWRVTLNTQREGLEWIGLSLDKDKWFAVVKTVLNYWVQQNTRKLWSW